MSKTKKIITKIFNKLKGQRNSDFEDEFDEFSDEGQEDQEEWQEGDEWFDEPSGPPRTLSLDQVKEEGEMPDLPDDAPGPPKAEPTLPGVPMEKTEQIEIKKSGPQIQKNSDNPVAKIGQDLKTGLHKVKDLFSKNPQNSPQFKEMDQKTGVHTRDSFSQKIDRYLGKDGRPQAHRHFLYSLTAVWGLLLGLVLVDQVIKSQKIRPLGPAPLVSSNPFENLEGELTFIDNSDPFQAKGPQKKTAKTPQAPVKKKKEPAVCFQADKKSSLPLKLMSTIVLQDSVKSLAAVQIRSKKGVIPFREGEKIDNMAEIGKIERQRMVIKNLKNKTCEFLENRDKKPKKKNKLPTIIRDPVKAKKTLAKALPDGITNEGNSFSIKKDIRDRLLQDMTKVLTQAKAVPVPNDDGTTCYKMTKVKAGSIYSTFNIEDGDTICKINGRSLKDLGEIMNMFGQLKNIDSWSISKRKNGEDETTDFSFVD